MHRDFWDRAVGTALIVSLGSLIEPAIGLPYLLLLTLGGALAYRSSGRGSAGDYFKRLDEVLYAGERTIVTAALGIMTTVVFIDVVWSHEKTVPWQTPGQALGRRQLNSLQEGAEVAGAITDVHEAVNVPIHLPGLGGQTTEAAAIDTYCTLCPINPGIQIIGTQDKMIDPMRWGRFSIFSHSILLLCGH